MRLRLVALLSLCAAMVAMGPGTIGSAAAKELTRQQVAKQWWTISCPWSNVGYIAFPVFDDVASGSLSFTVGKRVAKETLAVNREYQSNLRGLVGRTPAPYRDLLLRQFRYLKTETGLLSKLEKSDSGLAFYQRYDRLLGYRLDNYPHFVPEALRLPEDWGSLCPNFPLR